MCGRYYINSEMTEELKRIFSHLDKHFALSSDHNVNPSEAAPVLVRQNGIPAVLMARWGFTGRNQKGLVINARAETVHEKPLFRKGLQRGHCIIPARGFYEWDHSKDKGWFTRKDSKVILMAGIYDLFQNQPRFTVLTTAANASMADVHERMPLIFSAAEAMQWLQPESGSMSQLLSLVPPPLERQFEYRQQTFDFGNEN